MEYFNAVNDAPVATTCFIFVISFDDGNTWNSFQQNLPVTPITDIKIHRNDVVLSTMGRSFWIMDNIDILRNFDNFLKSFRNL